MAGRGRVSRRRASGVEKVSLTGWSNFINYRRDHWILCATSRTMITRFARYTAKTPHLQENKNVITQ
ncbi:Uncharacterised protein [Metakosakonia massiliensis]|uniref:Uncharacterized protein n=1 Tax=Phytobacter massiliensis TaxID=1485952 RepID=A0A6N3H8Y2_9ENTR